MADKNVYVADGLLTKYHDNGDGTYSPTVHLDASIDVSALEPGTPVAGSLFHEATTDP